MKGSEDLFGYTCEKGETIFQEGDRGDTMYLIQSGAVEIIRPCESGEVVLALLEKGDFFGEMVLLDDLPRSSTVRAITRTRLLPLTRRSLMDRMGKDPSIALHLLRAFCQRIEATNRLSSSGKGMGESVHDSCEKAEDYSSRRAGDALREGDPPVPVPPGEEEKYLQEMSDLMSARKKENVFNAGDTIFLQGDEGGSMFIITEGEVAIFDEESGAQYLLATLGKRDFFGEMALLSDRPRSATAIAAKKTTVFEIEKKDFLSDISSSPELGLYVLQVLAHRLRYLLLPAAPAFGGDRQISTVFRKKGGIVKAAFLALSSCAGCSSVLLADRIGLNDGIEGVDVEYCPFLMDNQEMGEVDVAVIEGVVRTKEDLNQLNLARERSRFVIAWGTCATHGGVPAMANRFDLESLIHATYGQTEDPFSYYLSGSRALKKEFFRGNGLGLLRKTGRLCDFVRVDSSIAGCPPDPALLAAAVKDLFSDIPQEKCSPTVCKECPRLPVKSREKNLRLFPASTDDRDTCFVSLGVFCEGLVTRGGCKGVCPAGGMPCWGCRGPSERALAGMDEGDPYERVLIRAIAQRTRIEKELIGELLKTIRRRSASSLAYTQAFIPDRKSIR